MDSFNDLCLFTITQCNQIHKLNLANFSEAHKNHSNLSVSSILAELFIAKMKILNISTIVCEKTQSYCWQ